MLDLHDKFADLLKPKAAAPLFYDLYSIYSSAHVGINWNGSTKRRLFLDVLQRPSSVHLGDVV